MEEKFIDLEKVIKASSKGRPVYYIANPGNWGDALIRYGTLKFFKKIHLVFKEISMEELNHLESINNTNNGFSSLHEKPTLLYGGGGAWCKLWNHSVDYIDKLQDKYNIIVLPSTYESTYMIHNTIFFTRDKFESKKNMSQATFCHDMAFYIGNEFTDETKGEGTGYFFRTDLESADQINIPSENHDISLDGNHLSDIPLFFESINQFSVIHTDRLHVSIAAVLLKKEVHLYPGSYFKNKAVYLSTIKGHFENVIFHEDFNFLKKSANITIKKHDLVSIIIPCYNQAQYLEESVQSAVNQTYPNIEIIIVNDGSTDNTQEISEKLEKKYHNIRTLSQNNQGLSTARNNGIAISSGEYILPLDSDDHIDKEMIFKCVSTIQKLNVDIISTDGQTFGKRLYKIIPQEFPQCNLLYANCLVVCSLYRREVWTKTGGYKKNMKGGYEDWEFWINAYKHGFKFKRYPEVLFHYRTKEESMYTAAKNNDTYLKSKMVMNNPELYPIFHVQEAINSIRETEELADFYFYHDDNIPVSVKKCITEAGHYIYNHPLKRKQIIRVHDQNVGLCTLDILKNSISLEKLYKKMDVDFILFYAPLRFELETLRTSNFAWKKDEGIVKAHGSIFPFVSKPKRKSPKKQLIAYQSLFKYQTKKQQLILENKVKILTSKEILIKKKDEEINKNTIQIETILSNIQQVTKFSILKNPIKKYKAYKDILAIYRIIERELKNGK